MPVSFRNIAPGVSALTSIPRVCTAQWAIDDWVEHAGEGTALQDLLQGHGLNFDNDYEITDPENIDRVTLAFVREQFSEIEIVMRNGKVDVSVNSISLNPNPWPRR